MARETLAQAKARANKAEKDLEQLKEAVVEKARELTEAHGWCDEVDRALQELGLITNEPVVVQVTVRNPLGLKAWSGQDTIEDAVIDAIDYCDGDAYHVEVVSGDAR